MKKNSKFQTKALRFESFEVSPLSGLLGWPFVSDFVLRISDFLE